MSSFGLNDDGTLDTVIECMSCGEEWRSNFAASSEGDTSCAECNGDGCDTCYITWVEAFITEAEAEHECYVRNASD